MQVPDWQVSPVVQELRSSQAALSGLVVQSEQMPVAGLQVPGS